jgi:hypothetical protein
VDVLASAADARRLIATLGAEPGRSGGTDLFRSPVFAKVGGLPLPVDVMGGFEVRGREGWAPVWPATRVRIGEVFVPELAEQARIYRLFGRPKDLARAARLEALAST